MSKSLKKLETFELLCMNVFEAKSVIYNEFITRIQYARERLDPDPKASWSREAKRLNREDLAWPSWKEFIDFLKELVSPIKLRQLMLAEKIKRLAQRQNQTVSFLIAHLDDLEKQWFEQISKSIRVTNFLTSLHDYIKNEIQGRQLPAETRKQAHEAAVLVEKTVKRPPKVVTKPFERKSTTTTTTTTKTEDETDDVQGAVTAPTPPNAQNKKRKRDENKGEKKDKSNIECWSCHEKGHYQSQCLTKTKKVKNQ